MIAAEFIDDISSSLEFLMESGHEAKIPKYLGTASPKSLSWQRYLEQGKVPPMANGRADSKEAIAERLILLRKVISGDSQTAFASRIGIEPKRWNNFERGYPLSKEIAILLVKKFTDITLDWLFLGVENGLSVKRQRELADVGKSTTEAPARSKGRG